MGKNDIDTYRYLHAVLPKAMSMADVAKLADCALGTVKRACAKGKLTAYSTGKRIFVVCDEKLDDFIAEMRKKLPFREKVRRQWAELNWGELGKRNFKVKRTRKNKFRNITISEPSW